MRVWVGFLLSSVLAVPMAAQTKTADVAILALMDKSAADWNRGDIESFATCYKDSPDILFIGRTISRGYAQMMETYRQNYGSPEKMGTLTYSQLEVHPLDEHFATMTGHFHLERSADGGGNQDGYFLVVFENTKVGWKIIEDDSTILRK